MPRSNIRWEVDRAAMRKIVDRLYGGNVSAMETACGLSHGILSRKLRGRDADIYAGTLMQISETTRVPMHLMLKRKGS